MVAYKKRIISRKVHEHLQMLQGRERKKKEKGGEKKGKIALQIFFFFLLVRKRPLWKLLIHSLSKIVVVLVYISKCYLKDSYGILIGTGF